MGEITMIMKAWRLAAKAHEGQVDLVGKPYFRHVVDVYDEVKYRGGSEAACIVALLHDIIEDTDVTYSDLEKEGFSKVVIEAVEAITRDDRECETYAEYIKRVAKDPIASFVKKIDLLQNQHRCRVQMNKFQGLHERYTKALKYLTGGLMYNVVASTGLDRGNLPSMRKENMARG